MYFGLLIEKVKCFAFCSNVWLQNISFTDSETNATRVYNIPMLSGSAYIGQLYDATKDQLLFDKFLWESPISVNEEDITSVQTEAYIEESLSDRYDHFGVTASLSVSLYSGLIQVNSNKTYN